MKTHYEESRWYDEYYECNVILTECKHTLKGHEIRKFKITKNIDDVTCKQCLIRLGIRRDCQYCNKFKKYWDYCANCGKKFKK